MVLNELRTQETTGSEQAILESMIVKKIDPRYALNIVHSFTLVATTRKHNENIYSTALKK